MVIQEGNIKTMSKLSSFELESKGGREATHVDGAVLLEIMLKKSFTRYSLVLETCIMENIPSSLLISR